jgi:hypothetical protein
MLLKAVYKQLYTEMIKEYAARNEEATEMETQQKCILSGGVYLHHRLKKHHVPFLSDILYHKCERRARSAFGRAGVQETVPRFD